MSSERLYFLINKPYKVLSQFSDDANHVGLGKLFDLPKDVYPVGRLDMDSEGLLLLTNDKTVNHRLLHPKFSHSRTYHVEVDGRLSEKTLEQLQNGVKINVKGKTYLTQRCLARKGSPQYKDRDPPINTKKHPVRSWLALTLTEGKNRQVRKMTAKVGHPTLRLIRIGIEELELGDLASGEISQISRNTFYKKLNLL